MFYAMSTEKCHIRAKQLLMNCFHKSNRPFDSFSPTQRKEGAVLCSGASLADALRDTFALFE